MISTCIAQQRSRSTQVDLPKVDQRCLHRSTRSRHLRVGEYAPVAGSDQEPRTRTSVERLWRAISPAPSMTTSSTWASARRRGRCQDRAKQRQQHRLRALSRRDRGPEQPHASRPAVGLGDAMGTSMNLADRRRPLCSRYDPRSLVNRLPRCSAASVVTWLTRRQQMPTATRARHRRARRPLPQC